MFKSLKNIFENFNNNIKLYLNNKYVFAYLDYFYSMLRFGASPNDYFRYEFYKKSNLERSKFITYKRSQNLIKKFNDNSKIDILENKIKFNKYFKSLIKRDWLAVNKSNFNEFVNFLKKHKKVIFKPIDGGSGSGIFIYIYNKNKENFLKQLYSKHNDFLIESLLSQHRRLDALNSSSVNTARILSFYSRDNDPQIISSSLRIGNGSSCVDNLHAGGIAANINIETGIINYPAVDNKFNRYLFHPVSNEKIIGFKIPNWNKVKNVVINSANQIPEIRYIGWDIAILNDDVAVIEANHNPGHALMQMTNQKGNWTKIKKLI